MTNYFDVLPLHPKPEYLESLTGYLMRLAEDNGISSIDGISALCFPHQDRRITRDIVDYPPLSLDKLSVVGVCSEEILRTTTFFHLVAKFGRSTLPQPSSRFLSGCVSHYLRYCPMCLFEQQVRNYLLSWRFLILTCCCKHKCRLLETCRHCGELISLFTSPFKLGNCPKCQQSLGQPINALVVDEAELEVAKHAHDNIIFFLIPQPWEADSGSIIRLVGQRFAYMRQIRRLTTVEVSSKIGVTQTVIEGIERGDCLGRGATLQSYFKLAHFLCLSLKEVFSYVLDASNHVPITLLPPCPICQQSFFVTRQGYNRSGSQRYKCRYCHRSFTASSQARMVKNSRHKPIIKVTQR